MKLIDPNKQPFYFIMTDIDDHKSYKSTTIELFGKTYEASHKHTKNINNSFFVFLGFVKYYTKKSYEILKPVFKNKIWEVIFILFILFMVIACLTSIIDASTHNKIFLEVLAKNANNMMQAIVIGTIWGLIIGLIINIIAIIIISFVKCIGQCVGTIKDKINEEIPDIEEI